jgi:hypothetical protein
LRAVEQLRELHLAIGTVEDVILVDSLPRELAAFAVQLIAKPGEFFFFDQKLLTCFHPFIGR